MLKRMLQRFNIIDFLLMALVIISLAALLYRILPGGAGDDTDFEITYICDGTPAQLTSSIRNGAQCADGDTGEDLGEVTDFYGETGEGDIMKFTLRTLTKASEGDHGVVIGNTPYLKGKKMNLIVDDTVFEVYISDIKLCSE
ncbi:MAG: hypothetical protein ACI4DY_07115 [Monoglobaceae bacterium]